MNISEAIVFITGANRGLGLALAKEAVQRGAKKVYAGMRSIENFSENGIVPIEIDVSNTQSVQKAAMLCSDVNILINNAGIAQPDSDPLDPNVIENIKKILDINLFGLIRATQAFAPILKKNAESAIVNILSSVSWEPSLSLASYATTKAAAWSYTNSIRQLLAHSGVNVQGLHVGFIDTDLTRSLDIPKLPAQTVAENVFDGLERNAFEVLVGETTVALKNGLTADIPSYIK